MNRIVLSMVCAALPLCAAPANPQEQVDALLAKIDKSAQNIQTFQSKFKQTTESKALDEKDEAGGRLYFVKKPSAQPDQAPVYLLRFDYLDPDPSIMIMNEAQVIFQKPGFEPEIHQLVDDLKTDTLLAGFTSTERLRRNFLIKLGRETASRVTLVLTPVSDVACRNFRELRITFNRTTWLPIAVYQHKANDERITFQFDEIKVNYTIAAEKFSAQSLKKPAAKTPAAKKPTGR